MISKTREDPYISRLKDTKAVSVTLSDSQKNALIKFLKKINVDYFFEPLHCICGGNRDITIAERDRYGIPVQTVLCTGCGLMRSDPYLTPDSIIKFYRDDYRDIYQSADGADGLFKSQLSSGRDILEWLKKNLDFVPKVVFEIGCGAGGNLQAFRDIGCEVVGCDYDEEYLAFGRSKGLNLKNGGIEILKDNGKADLIILRHVIEHFLDPVTELKKIENLLKPEGVLYIEVPGIFNIRDTYQCIDDFLQNAHVWHFCLVTLAFMAEKNNFQLLYGDEMVSAAFRFSPNLIKLGPNPKEYLKILKSIDRTERLRNIPVVSLKKYLYSFLRMVLGDKYLSLLRKKIREIKSCSHKLF